MISIEKDKLYQLLTDSPDKQRFANILEDQQCETDSIDFKEKWIEKGKLAKIILAMANSGGGCIVFGIKETETHKGEPVGLSEESVQDEADVANSIKKYLPDNISWNMITFSYEKSEYEKMSGKTFQIILVRDTPNFIPFVSISEGNDLKPATIYTRRNTECVIANNFELQDMLDRRIQTQYISKIEFSEHLRQLSELYKYHHDQGSSHLYIFYESQDFIHFIETMIEEKKQQIRRIIGIE